MAKLEWDKADERFYETGLSNGVLYTNKTAESEEMTGTAWNGLISVSQSPSGAEANDMYADDIKYASIRSAEKFGGTVEAYMCPDEFYECDGSIDVVPGVTIGQQSRKPFGLSYRTSIGNGSQIDSGYKLHIVWNATASPSERQYQTINDSPEAITLSWEFDTTPVKVTGHKPTSHIEINSLKVDAAKLKTLEDILYGSASAEAKLPSPDEVIAIFTTTGNNE